MICNNILEAIGKTPLIKLNKMADPNGADIYVKFEGLNVGGSIKTRTAYNMIKKAEEQGLINKDSIIVEPTSGNQGIGLALVGAVRGYKTRIIMPDSVSEERRKLVRHYGAEVILVHDAGNIGACIEECLNLALKMQIRCTLYHARYPCVCPLAGLLIQIISLNIAGITILFIFSALEKCNQIRCYNGLECNQNGYKHGFQCG